MTHGLHPHDVQRLRELQMMLAQHGGQGGVMPQMPPQMAPQGMPPQMPQGMPQDAQKLPQGMPFGGGMPPQSGPPIPPPGVDPRMAIAQAMGPQGAQAPQQAGMDPARMAAIQKLQAAMSGQR